jgi:hypothetical protein
MAVPKSAMKRIGYFGEEGYMTLGDPYKTKVVGEAPTNHVAKLPPTRSSAAFCRRTASHVD